MNATQLTTETIAQPARLTSGWDDTPAETVDVEVTYLTGTVASWAMTDTTMIAEVIFEDGERLTIVPTDALGRDLDAVIGRTVRVQVNEVGAAVQWAAPDARWAADSQSLHVVG